MTTATTESVMTLPSNTATAVVDSPRVRRTRARTRVDDTARDRKQRAIAARMRRAAGPAFEVVYLDTADAWWLKGRSTSLAEVWQADYAGTAVGGYLPFRLWCRMWKPVALASAATLDSAKFFLVHPVRGPLFVGSVAAGVGAVMWG